MGHFEEVANEWDSSEKVKLMRELAHSVLNHVEIDQDLRILDFGCGTGLFGLEFLDFASHLHGVDTSSGMLEVFKKKVHGNPRVSIEVKNLEEDGCDLEQQDFDLIISSMAFHHLKDPKAMIQKLSSYLSPIGRMLIVDLSEEDGSFHPDPKAMGVYHFGFSKKTLEGWAKEANLNVDVLPIYELSKNGKNYKQFCAVFSALDND